MVLKPSLTLERMVGNLLGHVIMIKKGQALKNNNDGEVLTQPISS